MAIVFTFGISEHGVARAYPDEQGQLRVHVDGNCSVLGSIDLGSVRPLPFLLYGPGVTQPAFDLPVKPSLVFNQISDPDTHRTALQRCLLLCEKLPGIPVINHPSAVLNSSRDRVSERLQGIPGVRMPKTMRCAPGSPAEVFEIIEAEALKFPVIQRTAGDHNAKSMVLIESAADEKKLHVFPFDGRDFYLTEFVDYKNEQGVYHTQRIAMTGGEPYLRHAFFHDHWKVNSAARAYMRSHPELGDPVELADELERQRLPKAETALKEIAVRLELDYFGIDCNINEAGEVLVFEANANMNILVDQAGAIFAARLPGVKHRLKELIKQRSHEYLN